MIGEILSIFTSGGFGAIIGGIGSIFTRIEERKAKKDQYEHELNMAKISLEESKLDRQHELDMADKERIKTELEGEIEAKKQDYQALIESMKDAFKPTGIKWVDAVRSLMRPLITTFLLVVSTIIAIQVFRYTKGLDALSPNEVLEMYKDLIANINFLTNIAVTWWFGTRPTTKK
jgi:type III secretory pathway component EscV